ncbi:MAG: hypothetical protein QOE82_1814 [Thermoanaerobaculia bacterium]|nr:hypothetical protein [Thermoanaerobaculia bacterium]
MSKREPDFTEYDVDPEDETGEIDEELDAVIAKAAASLDRGEGIPWEVILKEWENEELSRSK